MTITTPGAPVPVSDSALPMVDAEIFRQALFARKGADRFGPQTRWSPGPGEHPLLAGATTHLICATHAMLTVGDHELVVGRVEHAIIGSAEPPLLHHQGRFTRPEPGSHHDQ